MKLFINQQKNRNYGNAILAMGSVILTITLLSLIFAMLEKKSPSPQINQNRIEFSQIFRFASPLFYFTSLSNLALGVALCIFGWNYTSKNFFYFNFLFVATAWISITFLVYWGLLAWIGLKDALVNHPFQFIISVLVHGIHPLVGLLALYFVQGKFKVAYKTIFIGVVFFSGYGFLMLILYFVVFLLKGQPAVIYPFLDFEKPFFYKGNNLWIIVILDLIIFALLFLTPLSTSIVLSKIFRFERIPYRNKRNKKKKL